MLLPHDDFCRRRLINTCYFLLFLLFSPYLNFKTSKVFFSFSEIFSEKEVLVEVGDRRNEDSR